ncbi:hypothetical protein WJX81_002557 [Elliptochloris bilobata]|uniref:Uncharacterized protein n=1 Tax=Elliptochloris bilobata TaxID=381761 RepID=A0AAW1R2V7_9CHLO
MLPSLIGDRPIRINLPIPGFPIDIVSVSEAEHIQVLKGIAACGRIHEVPSKDLPKWVQLYFSATRFWDKENDRWFVPFEGENDLYAARRGTIVSLLEKGYDNDDVTKVAQLARADASAEDLAYALEQVVNKRFVAAGEIPRNVTLAARSELTTMGQLIKPGAYKQAIKGTQEVLAFAGANQPAKGMQRVDVGHNIGVVASSLAKAVGTLQANLGQSITQIFTTTNNAPTPSVPRIALDNSTFGGLLAYPAVPGKTVFLLNINKAAGKTGNLFYTFGTGDALRACPFKPFFERFMGDLQTQLRSEAKTE